MLGGSVATAAAAVVVGASVAGVGSMVVVVASATDPAVSEEASPSLRPHPARANALAAARTGKR